MAAARSRAHGSMTIRRWSGAGQLKPGYLLRSLREGKLEPLPQDSEMFEWMVFAYQHLADHRAVVEVYQRLNPLNLPDRDRGQAKRLYEFCLTQLPEPDHATRSDQLRLL